MAVASGKVGKREQFKRSLRKMRQKLKEPPQVKFMDKFSFTLGVLMIVVTEWILLKHPEKFMQLYTSTFAGLVVWRIFDFYKKGYILYMLDLCYYVNLSIFLQAFTDPENRAWFDINYCFAMGFVISAIVTWGNSLVFQSMDKLTSCFIHVMPSLCVHAMRYYLADMFR